MPSHHTPPSGVSATLVKIVFRATVAIAFGLVFSDVPGATPKTPDSGLIACKRPLASGLIHAMSSPTIETFQSLMASGGISIARFVLPHALGKAAEMYVFSPCGSSTPRINMCSASQPSSRAMFEAMRKPKHFLPSNALPPYPDPNDQISRFSGKWTMYFSGLQGQGTSCWPGASGAPTLCMQGTTRCTLRSMTRNAGNPIRAIVRMLATT